MSGYGNERCPVCGSKVVCYGYGPGNSAPFRAQCGRGCFGGGRCGTEEEALADYGRAVRKYIAGRKWENR